MDEKIYNEWWLLHLRTAKGETLSPDEQIEYEAGLKELYEEERLQFQSNDIRELFELRSQIEQLQITNSNLKEKSKRLDKKIAALEKAYQTATGYRLAPEPHA